MPLPHLNLLVRWPQGPAVPVTISVEPDLEGILPLPPKPAREAAGPPTEEIGPLDLENRKSLEALLARVTRSADPEQVQHLLATAAHADDLLGVLGVRKPPPDPIEIRLADDA